MKRHQPSLFAGAPFRRPVIDRASGNFYTDVDGNRYLDLMSGQFGTILGHGDQAFTAAIARQMQKVLHTSTLHLTTEVLDAMHNLAALTSPNLQKVLLLSTGAEAVECAIRNAKFATKRDGVVGIGAGYHGLTLATQSISSGGSYARPRVPQTYSIPTPDWLRNRGKLSTEAFIKRCLQDTRKQLAPHRGSIAAFVFEPIISVGGMIFPPKQYFKGLREIAKEHGALLIADECQTGLGRTGKWFGYQQTGITPDILVLAKSAGLGFPVSAVLFNTSVAKKIEGKLVHFSTHQNDPLAARALLFLIASIRRRKLLPMVRKRGGYLLRQLHALARTQPLLQNPRGQGLMLAFDLPDGIFTKKDNPGQRLMQLLEDRGVNIQATRGGRTFRILPSYVISKKEIDFFISALRASLADLQ